MDDKVMSQLDVELAHAGEETTLSPKMLLLEQLRITPEKQLDPMEFLFRLFGRPCFPRRELVAITGKAKSGKTFVTSMLMAKGASPLPPPTGGGDLGRERLPSINRDYIVHEDDGSWRFDVMKLFLAAFQGENELQGSVLRERVMQLSGIVIPFKYNQLLHQALEQKVIEKMQRDGLTVYQPAPF